MKTISILFIHRSVGQNLLDDGKLAAEITSQAQANNLAVDFTDINNNFAPGVPAADTKPADYLAYFTQHGRAEDLVIIKSCYPNNAIKSGEALEEIKRTYQQIVSAYVNNSSGKLLIMTTPPLRPCRTNKQQAARARNLASWLAAQDFGPRVAVFDFYDHLAQVGGKQNAHMLKASYRRLFPWDTHPSKQASLNIAPQLASVAIDFIKR